MTSPVGTLKVGEPYTRERRIKDKNGRILYSLFPVYARMEGNKRPSRLCTFDTYEEARAYMLAFMGKSADA